MSLLPNCRFCRTPLAISLCDLGPTPLANSYLEPDRTEAEQRFNLHARVCPACFLVQVDDSVPPDAIFSDYAYFSSWSDSWVAHAKAYAHAMIARFGLGPTSHVVEIASNDGYLLQHFKAAGVPVIGIEPAANVAAAAIARGIDTEIAFFGLDTARRLIALGHAADLIAANNVLAHVPDIADFLSGAALLLKPDGVATFEFPHLLNLLREIQFDTIYHEHFSYLSLVAVEKIMDAVGLKAFDVEELPTHGGSLRLFAARAGSGRAESVALLELRSRERQANLDNASGYQGFAEKVEGVKARFRAFLAKARSQGRTVAAYGAAAKGNTFLNTCGVTRDDIVCVFDRSTAKQGKLLPGSHLPILSPDRLSEVKPDYLVILPWNLADEIRSQNAILAQWGGQFVIAVPEIRIV